MQGRSRARRGAARDGRHDPSALGGRPDPWSIPPTEAQLATLCAEAAEAAELARRWGWAPEQITIGRVITHAEAAANRDGRLLHDNYCPVIWGGTGERWDFLQLSKGGPPTGGDQLRARIRALLAAEPGGTAPAAGGRLEFQRGSSMLVQGEPLAVQIDAQGTSWALVAELLERYGIRWEWDAERRRLLLAASDLVPSYVANQVKPTVGWPLFEPILARRGRSAAGCGCWSLPMSSASAPASGPLPWASWPPPCGGNCRFSGPRVALEWEAMEWVGLARSPAAARSRRGWPGAGRWKSSRPAGRG